MLLDAPELMNKIMLFLGPDIKRGLSISISYELEAKTSLIGTADAKTKSILFRNFY